MVSAAQKERLRIIGVIKNTFLEADKAKIGIDRDKLIGEIILTFGSTRKKAAEYINDLLSADFIEVAANGELQLKHDVRNE